MITCPCVCHQSGYSVVHHGPECCEDAGVKAQPERDPVRPSGPRVTAVSQLALDAARKMRGWGPIPRNTDGSAKL